MEAATKKLRMGDLRPLNPNAANSGRNAGRREIPFVDLGAQQERIRGELDRAIARVLDHGQYIMGPEVAELERELAAFCGAKYAITCASGTDALLISMMAKGVGPGDAILCPGFTYPATPEAIALLGATPVFVDVRADTFNVDPAALEPGIAVAKREGLRPVGLIAVDLFGLPADYHAIRAAARDLDLWILADAAQSFGASYDGIRVGVLGEMTATSFFPAKPLGCYGDGGAIFTDDDALAEVMQSIRLHGKGTDKYDIVRIGVNGRLDTLQAAILIEKLRIFPDEINARDAVAERYTSALKGRVTTPLIAAGSTSVWAQYTVVLENGLRDVVVADLAAAGIPANIYYPRPLHHQPAYQCYPIAGNGLPVSEHLPTAVMSLPMHAYLDEANQAIIVEALADAIQKRCT